MTAGCDSCGENQAVTTCDVCGSKICRECDLEYGCKACGGGKQGF
ncbi:MAG: orotate phosphoribosyltransferase [Candidatus Nanosalina sp.]